MITYLCGLCTKERERWHRVASKVGLAHWDYRLVVSDSKKEGRG